MNEVKKKYSPIPKDEFERIIIGIENFFSYANSNKNTLESILNQASRTIYRLMSFKEIGIVIKSKKDGQFRYAILLGYRKEAEMANKELVFSENDDLENPNVFPHIDIGTRSEFHLAEYIDVEGVKSTAYNRPSELSVERKSFDDFMEGDYIDIDIRGKNDELLGWIELGRSKDGKLPSRSTVFWVELIANILSLIIQRDFKS